MRRHSKHPTNPLLSKKIIIVYAHIAGPKAKRTIALALDTGASRTMLPAEKIIGAGYKISSTRERMIKVFTASGEEYVPVVKISSISCLGITIRNINVACHNLHPESPVDGLLGLDLLFHVPAFVEFYKKIIHTI